jgi:hypothetical protein
MKQRRSELDAISGPATRRAVDDVPMPEQMTRHLGPDSEVRSGTWPGQEVSSHHWNERQVL